MSRLRAGQLKKPASIPLRNKRSIGLWDTPSPVFEDASQRRIFPEVKKHGCLRKGGTTPSLPHFLWGAQMQFLILLL
jgi:hypothetical protein